MEFLRKDQIEAILRDVVELFLVPHFESLGMDASGEWRESLEVVGDTIRGRGYTFQLVNGRAPGARPPIEPLTRWAIVKLGLDERQARGAAFAISNKIAKEGTEYYKQGGTTLLEILKGKEVIEFISRTAQPLIQQQVTLEITRIVRDSFK